MDIYGLPSNTQDLFRIDDLLDFSNDELFTSSSSAATNTTTVASDTNHFPPPQHHQSLVSDFTHDLCVPSEDVAELEWLSQFVDDSFTDFPTNSIAGTMIVRSDTSLSGRGRSKRSKATNSAATTSTWNWTSSETGNWKQKSQTNWTPTPEGGSRRCTHCASERTPQWRTGPLGPKTLCNACGVRYKSGRLVPEYRPAASPTFVLTQHSNSHRKVLELRRQKELLTLQQLPQQPGQQQPGQGQIYRQQCDFEVC